MFAESAGLLPEIISGIAGGTINPKEQNHTEATFTKLIEKEDGYFDIENPPDSDELDRKIRAFHPWPGVWTKWNGKIVKLLPEHKIQIEGKMSSRLGNVVLYDDLKRDIFELLEKQSQERHPDWSDEKVSRIALALTMAVIKFSMQQHEAAKTITFDAQEAVSFEGFSAPYILYSIARIASLFKKAPSAVHNAPVDYALLTEPVEKKLVMQLARFPGVVEKALDAYNPSVITTYCFELAQAFNDLYAQQAILTASEEALAAARLTLAGSVKTVLENALSVLTISPVEEM
jgi:arginyl-tRNA synthetase